MGHCEEEMSSLDDTLKITLLWISGHGNIGNEQADGLARRGSVLVSPLVCIVYVVKTESTCNT